MEVKEVTISKNDEFFHIFYEVQEEAINSFIDLNYLNLDKGFLILKTLYSSYSYYLTDDEEDGFIKNLIEDKSNEFKELKDYREIRDKVLEGDFSNLTYQEILRYNEILLNSLIDMLEIYETCNIKFSSNDLLPNVTENAKDYDRTISYFVYKNFYSIFYKTHKKIQDKILNFHILDFRDLIKSITTFYYAYSFYIQDNTKISIKEKLKDLFSYYSSAEFIRCYYSLINGSTTNEIDKKLFEFKAEIRNKTLELFDIINLNLPKSNIMPRKNEKVEVDKWGI